MNGPILYKAPLPLHPTADAESGRMLFEHLQSFLLSHNKEMDRIHKTSNQKSDLRFMVFYEAHSCGQSHAAYHGHGAHADHVSSRFLCTNVVRKGDISSREFAIQHALPPTY